MTDEIAFDLRAAEGCPTGVGRHLMSIVQALAEHRPDLPIRAYVRDSVADLPPSVRTVRISSSGILWHARTWWHLRRRPVRAYCSTSLIIPALTGVPALPVILDVISLLYPEYQTWRTKLAERLLMRAAVRRHPVIAGSETTKRDIQRLFGRCRAVVVPPWSAQAKPGAGDPATLERLGIEAPYALFVGTIEPRKNVGTVIRAVAALRRRGRDAKLVLIGARGWVNKQILAELDAAEAEGTIVRTGYLPDRDRDAVFTSASCLVLPSIYEGFGLPLLEAMDRGLPCICSTAPAFEEVAGGAALMVEPLDVSAWEASLERVLTDSELARRMSLAGQQRAQHYCPEETAACFDAALAQLR